MDNIKLGNFISELRKEQGMTQKDLAQLLNVTDKAVSKWERGKSFPDVSLMEPLASALKITPYELFICEKATQATAEEASDAVLESIKYTANNNSKRKKIIVIAVILLILVYFIDLFAFIKKPIDLKIPADIYENNQAIDSTYVEFEGKLSLSALYSNKFTGLIKMHTAEMEVPETMNIFLLWSGDSEYDTNGTWFLYPASSTGEYIKTLSMDYVVITKDMKEFAMAFDDGKIIATSNEIYKQLIDEMSRVHES